MLKNEKKFKSWSEKLNKWKQSTKLWIKHPKGFNSLYLKVLFCTTTLAIQGSGVQGSGIPA